jgi:hypothetical protein
MHALPIISEFRSLESNGLVRLRAEEETESYFSVYGKPESEKERQEMLETLERTGCWCVISEFYYNGAWHFSDSVGLCTGYENPLDPEENTYVVDLMRAAIDSRNQSEPI